MASEATEIGEIFLELWTHEDVRKFPGEVNNSQQYLIISLS